MRFAAVVLLTTILGALSTTSLAREGALFSDAPLPFGILRSFGTTTSIRIDELGLPGVSLQRLSAELELKQGKLVADPLRFHIGDAQATGRVVVDVSQEVPVVEVRFEAPNVDMGKWFRNADATDLLEGRADLAVNLRGRGTSVAAIAGSLDGEAKFLMDQGRAKTKLLDDFVGGARRLVGMLLSRDSEWSRIHCMAAHLRFDDGIAHADVLLVDTEASTLVGQGQMNLKDEVLDLEITPQPKEATLTVAVPVEIGGTLAEPTFRPDKMAVAKKIGGLLSIAVFPPAAIASLADLGSDDHPCLELAAGGEAAKEKGLAESAEEAGRKVLDGVGEGARKLREGVGGLFSDEP